MARRQLHDAYFRQAKAEGYAARSAFKLKQIQDAKQLIRPGNRVLDLGCAPGAWLQVAAELVGPSGSVVGLDLQRVRIPLPPIVHPLVGDAWHIDPTLLLTAGSDKPAKFDVVLSDMAPNTTGHADSERSIQLCHQVLTLLPALLKPTGNLAMKVFEGALYRDLLDTTGMVFSYTRGYKPKASRDVSREMYIIAYGYTGGLGERREG